MTTEQQVRRMVDAAIAEAYGLVAPVGRCPQCGFSFYPEDYDEGGPGGCGDSSAGPCPYATPPVRSSHG